MKTENIGKQQACLFSKVINSTCQHNKQINIECLLLCCWVYSLHMLIHTEPYVQHLLTQPRVQHDHSASTGVTWWEALFRNYAWTETPWVRSDDQHHETVLGPGPQEEATVLRYRPGEKHSQSYWVGALTGKKWPQFPQVFYKYTKDIKYRHKIYRVFQV